MGNAEESTVAVLLAAGAGSRFAGSGHKLLADLDGESVAGAAVRHALAAEIGQLVVVTGAVELDSVVDPDERITMVHNPRWADGQATSLWVAIDHADRVGAEAIVVGLADQPFLEPESWRRVAASDASIAVATYDGRRRHPVRLGRDIWPLVPTSGDEGARSIVRLRPDLVEEIPCPGSAADIDTLEDLQAWQNRSSTNSP